MGGFDFPSVLIGDQFGVGTVIFEGKANLTLHELKIIADLFLHVIG